MFCAGFDSMVPISLLSLNSFPTKGPARLHRLQFLPQAHPAESDAKTATIRPYPAKINLRNGNTQKQPPIFG
jgi:hypothetical protein